MKTENYDGLCKSTELTMDEIEQSPNLLLIDNRNLVARIKDLELAVERIESLLNIEVN